MRKNKVLELIPHQKTLKSTLKMKQKELGRLSEEVIKLESQLSGIDGVLLHQGFPIRIYEPEGGDTIEVNSGCDDVTRYAVISPLADDSGQFRVTSYKAEGNGEGRQLAEGVTQRIALRTAKDYVATGQTGPRKTTSLTADKTQTPVKGVRKSRKTDKSI